MPLSLFSLPYASLTPCEDLSSAVGALPDRRGAAVVWHLAGKLSPKEFEAARCRAPGLPLVAVLPKHTEIRSADEILRVVEFCRPQSVLPWHETWQVLDLRSILRRPPDDLPVDVTEYLTWRGLILDLDARRMVRQTLELSADLRTVRALSRSLYISRRALGRRFARAGLPVPSHWLHLGRILRAAVRLQNSDDSLFVVATSLGYPDGFALSNQMRRLVGVRPSLVRARLGWEWLLEAWLETEARAGGFSLERARSLGLNAPSPKRGRASLGAVSGNGPAPGKIVVTEPSARPREERSLSL